ncbi:hypothetical protein SAMN04488132_1176 [Sediminibacterium ginsengisoli]|uniref:Uncharacterized protein n=1 Tax=Sediminibacterium ginsengisoli TaxID=413434 RepID=A0A1T4RYZ8_9BACT|nr:hypothetical protein SAMN04488132_1176 [Sediminibacterium ginsengisoli]
MNCTLVAYCYPTMCIEDMHVVPISRFDVSMQPYIIAFLTPKRLYNDDHKGGAK